MKRTKTSKSWMAEHVNDPFVQRAKSEGWRARAAYKLMEIDDKDKLIRPGMIVVDLGAAPGSWSQVANKRVGEWAGSLRSTCCPWSLSRVSSSCRAISTTRSSSNGSKKFWVVVKWTL
jgi:hypothetical protein